MENPKRKRKFETFLLVSFLVHCATFAVLMLVRKSGSKLAKNETIQIQLRQSERTLREIEREKQMQIVQMDPKKTPEPDNKDAQYWSSQNQKVEQQTKAANVDDFKNTANSRPPQHPTQSKTPSPGSKAEGRKLAENIFKSLSQEMAARTEASQPGGSFSATDDHLKEVKTGQVTMLNTREFKFYSYYERVRTQLKQHWRPLVQKTMSDIHFTQRRVPASEGEKITRLGVRMSGDGLIQEIIVLRSSGVNLIDNAAVEAFRRAGPFPNPPTGMVEKDGSVRLQWEFVLLINA